MTGFLNGDVAPFSIMTVRALADLGYTVDVTQADDFLVTCRRRRRRLRGSTAESRPYYNDLLKVEYTIVPFLDSSDNRTMEG